MPFYKPMTEVIMALYIAVCDDNAADRKQLSDRSTVRIAFRNPMEIHFTLIHLAVKIRL